MPPKRNTKVLQNEDPTNGLPVNNTSKKGNVPKKTNNVVPTPTATAFPANTPIPTVTPTAPPANAPTPTATAFPANAPIPTPTAPPANATFLASTTSAVASATAEAVASATSFTRSTVPWNMFNAIAFLILIAIIIIMFNLISQNTAGIQKVKKNWAKYRCQPSVMPFAALYGQNTADNFSFCMKNIFMSHATEVTSPFTSILGLFSEVLGDIYTAMNSMRESVASMGGGINVIFQDFTDRITFFFFQLRISAIRIKTLIGRMYALMFSVLYMGMSSVKAGSNFSNTALFSFLDTFCFVPETKLDVLGKGLVSISDIVIGDVLLPTKSRVTSKFHFTAHGQPMVKFKNGIEVSTNHYILHKGSWIESANHPDAIHTGPYSRESLFCLNTSDHTIPIGSYVFRDYDETDAANLPTMRMIEERLAGKKGRGGGNASSEPYPFKENSPSFHPSTLLVKKDRTTSPLHAIRVGDVLSTGSKVVGIVHKEVTEIGTWNNTCMGSATLVWTGETWSRIGSISPVQTVSATVFVSLIVVPNSQIELADGAFVRDYLELCSPDAEEFYEKELNSTTE